MSHFTVLVIGPNPEKQLEPYDESIEVGKYQRKLVSEEDKQSFLETYTTPSTDRDYAEMSEEDAEANKLLSFDELYEKYGEDWNGHEWEKNEAGEWAEFSTYNPKSKWDWYMLGGRWSGFFKVKKLASLPFHLEGFTPAEVNNFIEMFQNDNEKFLKITSKYNGKTNEIRQAIAQMVDTIKNPPLANHVVGEKSWTSAPAEEGWADQLLKRDVDFEGMRKDAEDKARERYNEVLAIFGGVIPKLDYSWKTIIDKENSQFNELTIDLKREFYHNQPAVLELKKVQEIEGNREKLGWFFDLDDFQCTLEEYIQRARNSAISTFAVVKDGKWYEKGEMGWWACVSNEKDNWEEEFAKLLDETPDDTLLSMYDCHI